MRVLLFAISCYALTFTLPGFTEYCFSIEAIAPQVIWGAYIVSGDGDTNVLARVFDSKKKPKYASAKTTREGKFEIKVAESQMYELCFRALDAEEKEVGFEFSKDLNINEFTFPKGDEFEPLNDDISLCSHRLDEVYRNLEFYESRERVNRDLTERTCDNILWSVLLKIIVLCGLSLTQLYVLQGFFNMDKLRV